MRWKKCCYGREKNLGQYSSLSQSPTHLSHTTEASPLSRINCERYIYFFIKKCVSFVRSLKLVNDVGLCFLSCICITAIQHISLFFICLKRRINTNTRVSKMFNDFLFWFKIHSFSSSRLVDGQGYRVESCLMFITVWFGTETTIWNEFMPFSIALVQNELWLSIPFSAPIPNTPAGL